MTKFQVSMLFNFRCKESNENSKLYYVRMVILQNPAKQFVEFICKCNWKYNINVNIT